MTDLSAQPAPPLLPRRPLVDLLATRRFTLDNATLDGARAIIDDVRARGMDAVRHHAERLGDLAPGAPIVLERAELAAGLDRLDRDDRAALEAAAERIGAFAAAQRAALGDLDWPIPLAGPRAGGRAGHRFCPVATAGCYAPGGRYPLPSSALMTVIPARAAGVGAVWLASPKPTGATLAAAAIAGADGLLACGGAQAIASLAFGAGPFPPADVLAGPGNRWVTAAKQILSAEVRIDMLAGPSEIVIIADDTADPELLAADLLAQAEHDTDALPILITTSEPLIARVETALRAQLADLPTAETAIIALARGAAILVGTLDAAAEAAEALAPEHLQLITRDDDRLADALTRYGALFIGPGSAEVFGDYGAGPNHTLPTASAAASSSGLSVLTFLTCRTWLRVEPGAAGELCAEAARIARMEGLEGHARAAERRAGLARPAPASTPPPPRSLEPQPAADEDVARRLEVAVVLAREAGARIRRYFRGGIAPETKADGSFVTRADREAEMSIRRGLVAAFPDDGILGEEYGAVPGASSMRWVIDPIDGTESFVRGVPLFGTSIGLELEGRLVGGVLAMPELDEIVWGAPGLGAWWLHKGVRREARVSEVARVQQAMLCTTSTDTFRSCGQLDMFMRLATRFGKMRGWSDCYAYVLLATGRCDAVVEPEVKHWDTAAAIPIIEAAGGRFTDWRTAASAGGGIGGEGGEGGASEPADAFPITLASNGLLHEEVTELIGHRPDAR